MSLVGRKYTYNTDEIPVKVSSVDIFTTVIVDQQIPRTHRVRNMKITLTAIAFMIINGIKLPLIFVASRKFDVRERNLHTPKDTKTARSPKGKTNIPIFKDYINKIYEDSGYHESLLIWDSYRIHINDDVITHTKEKNIHILPVPVNATNECQPLDVSILGKVSSAHHKKLCNIEVIPTHSSKAKALSIDDFCEC